MAQIHSGLQTELLDSMADSGVTFDRTRAVHGKNDSAYGLHANVNTFTMSGGVDRPQFLSMIGFRQTACPFGQGAPRYCREIEESFDVATFAAAFAEAFRALSEADRHLKRCGFFLEGRDFPAKRWIARFGDGTPGRTNESSNGPKTNTLNSSFRVYAWMGALAGRRTTALKSNHYPRKCRRPFAFFRSFFRTNAFTTISILVTGGTFI